MSLGDFDAGTVVYGKFTTFRPSTGAPFTLGGTPALSVYKNNSTTQSTAGVTLTADFDSITGLNHFTIDTSADGTFYSAGSFFDIVITTGTVDSVSVVGSVVGRFTLNAAGQVDANVTSMANNVITSSVIATNALNNSAFTTGYYNSINAEVDTALTDYAAATLEGSLTRDQANRVMLSALAGKVSGAGTGTEVFRDTADSKDRITSTVDDDGNRTAVTINGT